MGTYLPSIQAQPAAKGFGRAIGCADFATLNSTNHHLNWILGKNLWLIHKPIGADQVTYCVSESGFTKLARFLTGLPSMVSRTAISAIFPERVIGISVT